ncbi:MAG TPA: hypothetical protein VGK74_09870 [Symbiobacteriaceae bacterium]
MNYRPRWRLNIAGTILLISLLGCNAPSQPIPPLALPPATLPAGPSPADASPPEAVAPAEASAVSLAVSPTGDWIAAGLDGLTLVDRSGHSIRPYDGKEAVRLLAWAPSGEWLLAGLVGGKFLLVRPADGRVVDPSAQLTGLPDGRLLTAWSPAGDQVLVTPYLPPAAAPIWQIMPPTGAVRLVAGASRVVGIDWLLGEQAMLRQAAGCCGVATARLDLAAGTLKDDGFRGGLAVSPDGKRFAESSYQNGQLTVTDVATGGQKISMRDFGLREPRPGVELKGSYLLRVNSWSPDSRFLSFTLAEMEPPGAPMLRVQDMGAGETYAERVVQAWAGDMVWLGPSGDFVYTTKTPGGGLAVFLNGSQVADHPGGKALLGGWAGVPGAVRSRDGQRLAYGVDLGNGKSELALANLTAGTTETVPDSEGLVPLAFSSNGDRLVAARLAYVRKELAPGGPRMEGWEAKEITTLSVTAAPGAVRPFWGPPGTAVWSAQFGQDFPLSVSYAPLLFRGRTLYPVGTREDVFFFRQEGDAVFLDGRLTHAGTLEIWNEPRLLYRGPLTVGATFTLQWEHHNFGVGPMPYRVVGFETVTTPAGNYPTVVLESDLGSRSWWSPGIGQVQAGDVAATRVESEPARPLNVAARLDDTTTGFLAGGLSVLDQDGRVLLDEPINWIRSQVWWADVGASAPIVLYFTHSQAEPNRTYRGFVYRPERKAFEPVRWRLPDGRVKDRVAGDLEQVAGQAAVQLRDDERYPPRSTCVFRWNGTELACAAYTGGFLGRDEWQFVYGLTRALDEASWAGMFLDAEQGRKAYRATRREDGRNQLMSLSPTKQADGTWVIEASYVRATLTVVRQGDDWRVATWMLN